MSSCGAAAPLPGIHGACSRPSGPEGPGRSERTAALPSCQLPPPASLSHPLPVVRAGAGSRLRIAAAAGLLGRGAGQGQAGLTLTRRRPAGRRRGSDEPEQVASPSSSPWTAPRPAPSRAGPSGLFLFGAPPPPAASSFSSGSDSTSPAAQPCRRLHRPPPAGHSPRRDTVGAAIATPFAYFEAVAAVTPGTHQATRTPQQALSQPPVGFGSRWPGSRCQALDVHAGRPANVWLFQGDCPSQAAKMATAPRSSIGVRVCCFVVF